MTFDLFGTKSKKELASLKEKHADLAFEVYSLRDLVEKLSKKKEKFRISKVKNENYLRGMLKAFELSIFCSCFIKDNKYELVFDRDRMIYEINELIAKCKDEIDKLYRG